MRAFLLAIDWSLVRVGLVILGMGVITVVLETVIMVLFKFDRTGNFRKHVLLDKINFRGDRLVLEQVVADRQPAPPQPPAA